MAYDITVYGAYPNRSNHYIALYVRRDQTDVANNRSTYAWQLSAHRSGGWQGTYYNDPLPWNVNVAGYGFSGSAGLPFRSNVSDFVLASGVTGWVSHDANGYLNIGVAANHGGGQFGVASASGTFSTDRIPKIPSAPAWISATNVGNTSMRINWGMAADNGAGLDAYLLRRSTDPGFGTYVDTLYNTSNFSADVTGLSPGNTYYFRVYAHNGVGFGPSTSVLAQATLPSAPPILTVTPSISGTFTDLSLSPPAGSSGVTAYRIQRRPVGGSATTFDVTTNTYRDRGVIPGQSYEWRASAFFGSYQSPWSAWIAATMPNPNVNPGTTYWDGDSPNVGNGSYSWAGTPDLSQSVLTGVAPLGWMAYNDANPSGSQGVVYRALGGLFGQYAAQLDVRKSATAIGLAMGISPSGGAVVQPGEPYWGSLYARILGAISPAVFQAGIAWYTSAGVPITTTWGDTFIRSSINDNFQWGRYTAFGYAPANAGIACPVIRDAGTTENPFYMYVGTRVMMDGAMISLGELFPYFDGSTPDVPGYDYQWVGAANASPSIRHRVSALVTDPLADPDCVTLPVPPTPPTVPSDCIDEGPGEWRRYVVQVPASEVHIWTATLPTIVLHTGSFAERQVRVRFFPNPDGLPPREMNTEVPEGELILTYVPPNSTIVLDGVAQRVWAQVNGGDTIPANHLLYGTGGSPATWPELTCGVEYLIALDVPTDAPSGNLRTELSLTQRV